MIEVPEDEDEPSTLGKRFKRFRSRHVHPTPVGEEGAIQRRNLKEMIFLRDLHFGFLPDDCEQEFKECFKKIAEDAHFAARCFKLALLSRNEDLVRVLLDQLDVTKDNFHTVNAAFLDPLLLEAVELDDLESIQGILAWRDDMGSQIGLTEVDKKLLKLHRKAQEVIVAASVRNNYPVVKILYADGYKIFDKIGPDFYGFPLSGEGGEGPDGEESSGDLMESYIDRIRSFKAMASPSYMAMTYSKDPVEHAFNFTKRAEEGMHKEPEFRSEYMAVRDKCRTFAVNILDSCRNSTEVEQVLHGTGLCEERPYARLYRALHEDQKEFVSHPYCQVLLHAKWLNGSQWIGLTYLFKLIHICCIVLMAPLILPIYIFSPKRNHSGCRGMFGHVLRIMDRPINRFILDMFTYFLFLCFLLLSVIHGVGDHKKRDRTWYFNLTCWWVVCYCIKDASTLLQHFMGRITMTKFRIWYAAIMDVLFVFAIGFKIYGYEVAIKQIVGAGLLPRTQILDEYHPVNIGANLYGVAACMAFLKLIFHFEIHYRFGPILFCIKNVFWDILSVMGSFVITVFAFGVGLVSVYGIFEEDAEQFSTFQNAFKTLFWIIFDPGKEEYADIIPDDSFFTTPSPVHSCCCGNDTSSPPRPPRLPFPFKPGGLLRPARPPNSTGGPSFATVKPPLQDQDESLSHRFGIYIWAFYQVFVVLIMLNLLISLMTTTFSRIQANSDREWKFTRASIWIHYFDDRNAVPVPVNIVPSVHSVVKVGRWLCCRGDRSGKNPFKEEGKMWNSAKLINQERKRRIYEILIERVFRSEEKKQGSKIVRTDIEALEKEISIDIADLRRDVRNLRRDLKLPTRRFVTPRDGYANRKISHAIQAPRLNVEGTAVLEIDIPSEEDQQKSNMDLFTDLSYKLDNSPGIVKNLVQTLGLIEASTPKTSITSEEETDDVNQMRANKRARRARKGLSMC